MIVQIEIPDTILEISSNVKQDIILDISISLYQRKIYPLSKSAQFAGLSTDEFKSILTERAIKLHRDDEAEIRILDGIERGAKEVKLHLEGKKQLKTLQSLINEL
jgi:predicted HTH domain antitoxin